MNESTKDKINELKDEISSLIDAIDESLMLDDEGETVSNVEDIKHKANEILKLLGW